MEIDRDRDEAWGRRENRRSRNLLGGGGDAEYKARHLTFSDVYDVSRMTVAIWLPILQLAFIVEAFTMHTGCVLGLHCCS